MTIDVMVRVWNQSRQDGTDLLAMLALADWADSDGVCWWSNGRIAERIRREERSVTRVLSKLRDSGEIYAPPQHGAGVKTLKFVTIGLEKEAIIDVLIRRFELEPDEAILDASEVIRLQQRYVEYTKKPVIGDGFSAKKKPVTCDGYKLKKRTKKPVTGDRKNPSPVTGDPKEETTRAFKALAIDGPPPPLGQTAAAKSGGGGGGGNELKEFLEQVGIGQPKLSVLLALPHVTIEYARAHLAAAPNTALAIYRMERNWGDPKTKKRRGLANQVPPEYENIVKR